MASESTVQKRVWGALAMRRLARSTLFRSNSGKAWLSGGGEVKKLPNGAALVPLARPVALGLATMDGHTMEGLGDLTGWTDIEITPEMVGRRIPVFTMIETKETGGGRKRKNQINAIQQVHRAGGIAGFAANEQQAHEIVDAWIEGRSPEL